MGDLFAAFIYVPTLLFGVGLGITKSRGLTAESWASQPASDGAGFEQLAAAADLMVAAVSPVAVVPPVNTGRSVAAQRVTWWATGSTPSRARHSSSGFWDRIGS